MKRQLIKKTFACVFALFVLLTLVTTTPAKLAANKLSANKLGPYSAAASNAAASQLAGSRISSSQLGMGRYAANPDTVSGFMVTDEGREGLGFIVRLCPARGLHTGCDVERHRLRIFRRTRPCRRMANTPPEKSGPGLGERVSLRSGE